MVDHKYYACVTPYRCFFVAWEKMIRNCMYSNNSPKDRVIERSGITRLKMRKVAEIFVLPTSHRYFIMGSGDKTKARKGKNNDKIITFWCLWKLSF